MNPAIKRFLRLLIAVLVALALVSCQTENKTDDTKDTKNTNAAVNSTEENMQKQKETTEARITEKSKKNTMSR